ncbi:MAG: chemotaxis response regulator protein-glutamate methylesterase [Spirochaetes bacterium]|nr:chemotaxis response regulator protein-glutamate methylesterase [Spirochaetota bacterium]MBN2770540.1 chemotaxis response regulator protein-glutamate methylesterase [Spirochaetota bacterium]
MADIRVLCVDDSALIRKLMNERLGSVDGIDVIATAPDPFIAAEKIKTLNPDVVTLDIEMPRMDGLTFLEKLMKIKPLPVIMASSLTDKGAEQTIKAIKSGAFDFVLKPQPGSEEHSVESFIMELAQKIKSAAKESVRKQRFNGIAKAKSVTQITGDCEATKRIIAIGASTGGTEVIATILTALPEKTPGIVITQHMPPKFTRAFAERIDSMAKINVKEAEDGDVLKNSTAYIAPGGTQMSVRHIKDCFRIIVNDDPPLNRHKPSVDVLFNSVAECNAKDTIGIILTGMGADGADGMKKMHDSGCYTIAQDEKSSVIFGMPNEAIKRGGVDKVENIEGIIQLLTRTIS